MQQIDQNKHSLESHPFFRFVRDESKSSEQRLSFASCLAPFVMGFSDVNALGLRDESLNHPLQRIVNEHTNEDDNHWPMFLEDLETLGLNRQTTTVESLKTHWSSQNRRTRELTYSLMRLSCNSYPPLRIVLIEAVEATGSVAWEAFLTAAETYMNTTGRTLRYFGPEHADLETGHTMGTDDIDEKLRGVELSAEERVQASQMVDEVFERFSAMFDEQLEYASRNS
ncbi:hypothetical protein [Halostreptopolyspora alba]|uniref:hypothetical protein n=1 Tax=Halostreptopolyspora alba TaxID=2487137 RepID=UPI00371ECE05